MPVKQLSIAKLLTLYMTLSRKEYVLIEIVIGILLKFKFKRRTFFFLDTQNSGKIWSMSLECFVYNLL
jgi:hypothetical protein